jgi:tetratricopeptide (TPR) repeat protein
VGELARRLGAVAEGERMMRAAVLEASDVGEPISWAFVQQYLANFLAEQGADDGLDEALTLANEVVDMSGDGQAYRALGLTARSLVHSRRGGAAAALRDAREAQRLLYTIQLRSYCPHADIAVLRVLLAQGDTQAAADCADSALDLLEPLAPMGIIEPALRLWAARAHLAAGRRDDAARGVSEAMKCVRRRSMTVPEARRAEFFTGVWEHVALAELERELFGG